MLIILLINLIVNQVEMCLLFLYLYSYLCNPLVDPKVLNIFTIVFVFYIIQDSCPIKCINPNQKIN